MESSRHKIKCLSELDERIDNKVTKESKKLSGAITIPFLMLFKYRSDTILWFLFVILGGQLGTFINIVNRWWFQGYSFKAAIYPDSIFGNFYTYALVLIASLIHPLLIRIKNNETPIFRTITTLYSSLLIFFLIFTAVFFSFSSQQNGIIDLTNTKHLILDTKQFFIFITAIGLAIYSHGLSLMYKDEYARLIDDDYIPQENQDRHTLTESANKFNTDEDGIRYE